MRLLAILIIATAFIAPLLRPLSARATPHICSIGEKECRHGDKCPHRKRSGHTDHKAMHVVPGSHHGNGDGEESEGRGCDTFLECGKDDPSNYSDALEMPFLAPFISVQALFMSGPHAFPEAAPYAAFYPASIDRPPSPFLF